MYHTEPKLIQKVEFQFYKNYRNVYDPIFLLLSFLGDNVVNYFQKGLTKYHPKCYR